MGSFNDTCALSGLPITFRCEAYVMQIRRHAPIDRNVAVYPPDFFFPNTPMFLGTYDDYGRYSFSEDETKSMEWFASKTHPFDLTDRPKNDTDIFQVAIRKDVFEGLFDLIDDFPGEMTVEARADEAETKITESVAELLSGDHIFLRRGLDQYFCSPYWGFYVSLDELLTDIEKEEDLPTILERFRLLYILESGMVILNRVYAPTITSGQDENFSAHIVFNNHVTQMARDDLKERENDCLEDELLYGPDE